MHLGRKNKREKKNDQIQMGKKCMVFVAILEVYLVIDFFVLNS